MKEFKNAFNKYEWGVLGFFYLLIIVLSIIFKSKIYEVVATLCGISAASYNVKGSRVAFIFYPFYALIYGITTFASKNYGEAVLNTFYNFPLYVFTFYNLYLAKSKSENIKKIGKLSLKNYGFIALFVVVITLAYGYLLSRFNSSLPLVNALATSLALVASFLASRRFKDQWIFWNLYSLSLCFLWLYTFISKGESGLIYLALNIIYIFINFYGMYKWYKTKEA